MPSTRLKTRPGSTTAAPASSAASTTSLGSAPFLSHHRRVKSGKEFFKLKSVPEAEEDVVLVADQKLCAAPDKYPDVVPADEGDRNFLKTA